MHALRQTVVTTMLHSSGLNLSSLNCVYPWLGLFLSLVRDYLQTHSAPVFVSYSEVSHHFCRTY